MKNPRPSAEARLILLLLAGGFACKTNNDHTVNSDRSDAHVLVEPDAESAKRDGPATGWTRDLGDDRVSARDLAFDLGGDLTSSPDSAARPDASTDMAGCTGASPSFTRDVVPLFMGCAGAEICHGGAFTRHSMLVNAKAVRNDCRPLVRVAPGDPGRSYLMNKLTGVGMCPGTGRMPLGRSLTQSQIQTITDWICHGALDN